MSQEQECRKIIQNYLDQLTKTGLTLGKSKLKVFEKYASPEVFEVLKSFNLDASDDADRPVPEALEAARGENGSIRVPSSGGETYLMKEIGGEWRIADIELPCNCAVDEDSPGAGKCFVCGGSGKDGDEECAVCKGTGVCVECNGKLVVSLAQTMARHEEEHEHGEESESDGHTHEPDEPYESIGEFMKDCLGDEKPSAITKGVASFVWEMDGVYRAYCDGMQGLYEKYFDTDAIPYPDILFPLYERPVMSEPDPNPEEATSEVHEVAVAEEEFLLTANAAGKGKVVITELQVPCEWESHPGLQPHDEPLPCDCMDEKGVPDESCRACHGTGIVVCPICLGMGWMEIAPNPVTDEIIEDVERYRTLVPELYDIDNDLVPPSPFTP